MHYETYTGTIEVGKYSSDEWYGFYDRFHPKITENIKEILTKPKLFKDFELYVVGGILEDWLTWDMDLAIVGKYKPEKHEQIIQALDWIMECGFKHKIYPDCTFSEKLFDLHKWQGTGRLAHRWIYRNTLEFTKNGKPKPLQHYLEVKPGGLYRHWMKCPYDKNEEKSKEGYKYSKPVRLI